MSLSLLALGCGSSLTPTPVPPADVPAADVSTDAASPHDASTDNDGSVVGDASAAPSIIGRWRAVSGTFTREGSAPVTINDHDTPLVVDPGTGRTAPYRVNGMFTLQSTRVSLAGGVLVSGHFYVTQDAMGAEGYSAYGVTAAGVYDPVAQTFTGPAGGSPLRFTVVDADHIRFGEGTPAVTTFERTTAVAPRMSTLNMQCAAQLRHPLRAVALAHPRAALVWDVTSSTAVRRQTLGYALHPAMGVAFYPLTLGASPDEDLVQTVDGVRIAVGHPFAYDDVNEDGRYSNNDPPDTLRGISPIAVVWIDPATPSLERTRFADFQPGYQFAHVHPDLSRGAPGISPFDPSTAVCGDIPIEDDRVSTAVPNVLR